MRVPSLTGKTNEGVNSDNWVVGGSRMLFFKLLRYKCQSDDTNLRGLSVFFFELYIFMVLDLENFIPFLTHSLTLFLFVNCSKILLNMLKY